jgi:hypothetical protein
VRQPAGILQNRKTGRFHPIVFRLSPRPSSDDSDKVQRFKSAGHHTEGLATLEEAKTFIVDRPDWKDSGAVWSWDGDDVPAMVQDFDTSELEP